MSIPGESGLKYKLVCHFKLAAEIVRGGVTEFVNDTDGPAFLGRELLWISQSSRSTECTGVHS